jgi:hypothetical protein
LRARVPDGWKIISAEAANQTLQPDANGTVDISSLKNKSTIIFQVKQNQN